MKPVLRCASGMIALAVVALPATVNATPVWVDHYGASLAMNFLWVAAENKRSVHPGSWTPNVEAPVLARVPTVVPTTSPKVRNPAAKSAASNNLHR